MPFHEIFAVTPVRTRDKNSCVGRLRIKTVSESRGAHLRQPQQSKFFTLQVPPRALFISGLSIYGIYGYWGSCRAFLHVPSSGHRILRH